MNELLTRIYTYDKGKVKRDSGKTGNVKYRYFDSIHLKLMAVLMALKEKFS